MLHPEQPTQMSLAIFILAGPFARKPQVKGESSKIKLIQLMSHDSIQVERLLCEDHSGSERPGLSRPRVNVARAGRFRLVVSCEGSTSLTEQLHYSPVVYHYQPPIVGHSLSAPFKQCKWLPLPLKFETSKVASLRNEGVGKMCLLIDLVKGRY